MKEESQSEKIIFNSKQSQRVNPGQSQRVVCLGGGNAMPKAVLSGLKKYPLRLSAICAMLDSGGSSGRLRKDYDVTSPGDIRRSFITLANVSPIMKDLLNYRFQIGDLRGHNFANLLITALELTTNDYGKTIEQMRKLLNIKHTVLPVTIEKSNLTAILENGQVIEGERNIDIPKHDGNLKVKEVFLKPKVKAYPESLLVLNDADCVIIGPGDVYSSLAQILLVEGISEAICKNKAKKIYICNLMTKYGETNDFSVLDFAKEIEKYLGGKLDYVIYNNFIPGKKRLEIYKKEHPELLGMVRINKDLAKKKFIGENLLLDKGPIEHDSHRLARVILNTLIDIR